MRPGDQLAIASITKTIIAAQVMQLVEAGELDLDDRADHHLPEDLAFDTNGATVRDLLAMRSGIPDYVDALYESLLNDTAHVWTPSDLLALVPARRSPPASDFDYSSTNYVLLGLILEHTTGSSIASALRAGVLDGPDLERLVYQPDERPTFPRAQAGGSPAIPSRDGGDYLPSMAGATAAGAAGAIASDALTLARWWARLCGGEIVSDASLATMLDFDPTAAYGLGIQDWSADIAPSAIGNEGVHVGFVSRAGCLPESRLVVTVLINDEEADPAVVIHALLETLGSF